MNEENAASEQKFLEENGMTVDEAWEKVREWNFAGQTEEAERGCAIILEYVPEHPAKNLLEKLRGAANAQTQKKQSLGMKLGTSFVDSVEKMLRKKPPKTTSSGSSVPASENTSSEVPRSEKTSPEPPLPETPVLDDERLFATIGYAWIFCIIPLLMKRDSVFVQFHAKQGLVMAITLTVFDFTIGSLLNIVSGAFGFLLKLIYLGFLGYASFQAYQGKYWKIPGIYQISQKIKF